MRGVSLIEVAMGAAIISGVLLALGSVAQYSLNLTDNSSLRLRAIFLASEGVEAVKTLRDASWSSNIANLTTGTDYYLNFVTDHYETTPTPPALIDGVFQRRFVLEAVNRDVNDDITTTGGTLDANTKKLSVFISWTHRNITREEVIRTYITRLFTN